MKIGHLVRPPKEWGVFRTTLLTLCFFFVLGAVLGCAVHGFVNSGDDALLREYILQYAQVYAAQQDQAASLLSVLGVYFRYPLAVFAFGFTVGGVFFIPLFLLVQGFAISFSAFCFASALGRHGLTLALAAFGLRYLIVLPITLLLAVFSIGGALQLRRGRKKGSAKGKGPYGPDHYLRFAVCALVLLAGVIAELVWVPKLFQLALAGMM